MPTCSSLSLRVTVGSSVDTLRPYTLQQGSQARIQNEFFDGYVAVLLKGYGHSPYFDTNSDTFCIKVMGRFLKPYTADTIVFGNEFDAPLRLPMGSSIALKFATWFDPGLEADLYSEHPYALSPLLVTMNRLALQSAPLPDWPYEEGQAVEENTKLLDLNLDLDTAKARRTFFTTPQHREEVLINDQQVWSMDFCNPYLDFLNYKVCLPVLEIDVLRYWDGQPLRFIAKTKDSTATFFIVQFQLEKDVDQE
ncbi:hypothetical protein BDF14DRAFT_1730739 [Spinellus fusiger]|nr:hypothetical protein BDF14DRAFT_1730739 [Spinellus fusiger]